MLYTWIITERKWLFWGCAEVIFVKNVKMLFDCSRSDLSSTPGPYPISLIWMIVSTTLISCLALPTSTLAGTTTSSTTTGSVFSPITITPGTTTTTPVTVSSTTPGSTRSTTGPTVIRSSTTLSATKLSYRTIASGSTMIASGSTTIGSGSTSSGSVVTVSTSQKISTRLTTYTGLGRHESDRNTCIS